MNEAQVRKLVKERAVSVFGDWILGWIDVATPMCEACGKWGVDEIHHRLNRSQGGKWSPSNCVGLCRWCHQWVTEHPKLAAAEGLHLRRHERPDETAVRLWYGRGLVILHDDGTWNNAP